jgi:hypothetical protein
MNKPNRTLDLFFAIGLFLAATVGYAAFLIATAPVRVWGWAKSLWRME